MQLRSLLLQLGLQRLRLRLQVGQSLVQLYLLCRHFRDLRGFHIFSLCGRRSAAKRLKAELTADAAAVMTSEGEDAPPVYGRGGGGHPGDAAAPAALAPSSGRHTTWPGVNGQCQASRCGTSGAGTNIL